MSTPPLFRDYPQNLHVALANYGVDIRTADRISLAIHNDQDADALTILQEATGMDERGASIALRDALVARSGRPIGSAASKAEELLPA